MGRSPTLNWSLSMINSPPIGLEFEQKILVTPEMGVKHLGEVPAVLSTPSMIWVMEYTCLESVESYLEEGEQTVGTMVHIRHRAAVKIGEEVISRSRLKEIDRKRLLFEVEVVAGERIIGDGTHERFVIDMERFLKE